MEETKILGAVHRRHLPTRTRRRVRFDFDCASAYSFRSFGVMASGAHDATPLLEEEGAHSNLGVNCNTSRREIRKYARHAAMGLFLCVGALAATVAQQTLVPGQGSDFFEDAHLGGSKCDGTCPAVAKREWHKVSTKGSAHLLILGDSTDKLWHESFCNNLLREEERCVAPAECASPTPNFLPNNMQPFVCVEGDERCSQQTCYDSPSSHCWRKEEHRAAAACKPPVPEGPSAGFVHLFGADPEYTQDMKSIHNQYAVKGLPVKIKNRVKTAIDAFDEFTDHKRPVVVVVDVSLWWSGAHLGWWKSWEGKLGSKAKFDDMLSKYKKDMTALLGTVDVSMRATGRPYVLVGKNTHNRGFDKHSVEFMFHTKMGEVVKEVFEDKGHHFYDWRAIADDAKGWGMVDDLHQTHAANDLQTTEFMKWTKSELGSKFVVNLDAQEKALEAIEAQKAAEQKHEEAVARRHRAQEKAEAQAQAQKAKDDADWEAAEEERRQSAARETAEREAEEKVKLEKAQEEAVNTLMNIRGTMRGNIANIVGDSEAAAAAAY